MANRPTRPIVGGRKRGRPRRLNAQGKPIRNRPGTLTPEMIAAGWIHGGMIEPTELSDDDLAEWEKKIGRAATEQLFVRKRRRNPIPLDEELALLAEMKHSVAFLQGFWVLALRNVQSLIAGGIDRSRAASLSLTVVSVLLDDFVAGVAERRRRRKQGQKINRTPFGADSEDLMAQVRNTAYQMGLDYKRPRHRPKDSMFEVAAKVACRNQEGAAGVRHYHRKRL